MRYRKPFLLSLCIALAPGLLAAEVISKALPCGTVGTVGGLGAGTDLTRYTIDNARFPNAVCNDGTPGVFYYAPATRTEDQGKWIIFLQGGGLCVTAQTCAERWCHVNTSYGMDKMTSSLTKPSIRGAGFMSPDAQNRFGTWNRVLIFYCSSDTWGGMASRTLQATGAGGGTVEYTIQFRGSAIVEAVIDTLRNVQNTSRRRAASHDAVSSAAASPWPDLDSATDVIFAGSSGGGAGAKNNADRVGTRLLAANPSLSYRVLMDASTTPDTSQMSYAGSVYCAADPSGCTFESYTRSRYESVDVALYALRGDESCIAYHASREAGSEWICGDSTHVMWHHISSPMFIHQDLIDPKISDSFVEAGLGTLGEFATRDDLLLRHPPAPEEPRASAPGVYTLQCGTHEAFTNNENVFDIKVNGLSYNEVVWNWWRGVQPQQNFVTYSGTAVPLPGCPPPD